MTASDMPQPFVRNPARNWTRSTCYRQRRCRAGQHPSGL